MKTLEVDLIVSWMGGDDIPTAREFTMEDLLKLLDKHDIMIAHTRTSHPSPPIRTPSVPGKLILYLDNPGKKFRTR